MAASDQLKSLVDQLPDADGRGMLTGDNIDKQQMEKTIAAIAGGGRQNMLGLIEMLGEPGSKQNAKPHFALHCVVNHALVAGDEPLRRQLCEAIAEQLSNTQLLAYNRAYLCQQLQWAGRDEACEPLGQALLDDEVSDDAATALAAIGGPRAAEQLRAAAGRAEGKARLNLMDALAALADEQSAETFRGALADDHPDVRIAAAAGLAALGRSDSAEPLLKAADAAAGWERSQLTKSCLVLAERLAAAGRKDQARRVYERLRKSRRDDREQHIREAAARGLKALA